MNRSQTWKEADDFDPPLSLDADVYRRRITLTSYDERTVVCDLEDDFHHFVVTLTHDSERVVNLACESLRWPWSTCPGAAEHLLLLVGTSLSVRFTNPKRSADAHLNCTHQFDAASHAITHAANNRTYRQYDAEIASLLLNSSGLHNRLWVDGKLHHDWVMKAGEAPVGLPGLLADAPWRGGFMRWADANLDPDPAEIAIVLRRACDIGMGRGMTLDAIPVASDLLERMSGVCHSMQPDIAPQGLRNLGSIRDFSSNPERLAER